MFLTAGGMVYAYVYDVDCISPAEVYLLERSTFIYNGGNMADYPEFPVWLSARCKFDNAFKVWIDAWVTRIAFEYAQIWDPTIEIPPIEYFHLQMPEVNK